MDEDPTNIEPAIFHPRGTKQQFLSRTEVLMHSKASLVVFVYLTISLLPNGRLLPPVRSRAEIVLGSDEWGDRGRREPQVLRVTFPSMNFQE